MNRDRWRRRALVVLVAVSTTGEILAQSSASYRLKEHVFNAGGRPAETVVATSPGFRLSLESIGEALARRGQTGGAYRLDGGFLPSYPPPGEVVLLDILDDHQTLTWSAEPASTAYNIYTGSLEGLPGTYGTCAVTRIADTSWADPSAPSPESGVFYLVTGENRLWEEGTKGFASNGTERPNPAPCP